MDSLEHALAYAARGWRVVPIPPGEKYPRGIDRWQEKATCDPDKILQHWTAHPDHGVGIATGPESRLFVVDIDPRDGGDDSLAVLEAKYGPLPETVEAITGSGGRHLVFAWPASGEIRNSASGVLGVGIDVRGIGGQFVAAPTIHPCGTPYAWELEHNPLDGVAVADAPAWLLGLLQAPLQERAPRRERPAGIPIGSQDPGVIWAAATSWADELLADGAHLHSAHSDTGGGTYELWTRPGKTIDDGASASLYYKGSDVLKVFTSNWAGLNPEETYTLWGYHVATRHGGDFIAAARDHGREQRSTATNAPSRDAGGASTTPSARPAIVWNGRQADDVVNDAITALHAANDPPSVFVRAGQCSRLREDEDHRPMIEAMSKDMLRHRLAEAATWWRVNKDGDRTGTSPPLEIGALALARGHWPFPPLAGVVELPVLRPNGTFVVDHGYDTATRLYHWHRGAPYPPVIETPTSCELAAAVALIEDVLADFAWDTSADRANAWGLLLTPLVRPIIGQVPMALVDAPEPGTGKGLLVKVAAIITIGRAAGLMAWPTSDEELEKKVTAALMAGNTMVIFDNVEGVIRSSTLAAVLTADTWQGRELGRSSMITVPNRATWAATGNNIDVGGDLARRCYRIRLDARQAQPWKRTGFRHEDLEGYVASHRAELLHALCAIVRSWWIAGRPLANNISAMGGYTGWVRTIGGILEHAGVPGFLSNLAEFHATADRDASAWEAFLTEWSTLYGEQPVTVGELISKMKDSQWGYQLREVLPDDLAGRVDEGGFSRRLSLALRKRTGRHYGDDGIHLVEMPRDRRQVAIYTVTTRSAKLVEDNPSAGVDATPARPDALTSDDATSAGVAGVDPPLRDEKKESHIAQGANNSRNSRTPAPITDADFEPF